MTCQVEQNDAPVETKDHSGLSMGLSFGVYCDGTLGALPLSDGEFEAINKVGSIR